MIASLLMGAVNQDASIVVQVNPNLTSIQLVRNTNSLVKKFC